MTKAEMKDLKQGDVVESLSSNITYVVLANYGDRITAVRNADITNPSEWRIAAKANRETIKK